MTALDHNTPLPADELRGLESMCAALHAATETDPLVKDVAWRTFALIRAHRAQGAEVARLKAALADAQAAVNEVLEERDDMEKLLDTFAYTIAPEEVIGEHSSGNDPWANALDLVSPAAEVERLKTRLEAAEWTIRQALAEVEHEEAAHVLKRYVNAAEAAQAEQGGGGDA